MFEWEVTGADRATGEEISRRVTATTEEEARTKVGRSMLVEHVQYIEPPPAYVEPSPAAEKTKVKVPVYHGIEVGATLLRVLGTVTAVLGVVLTLIGFVTILKQSGGTVRDDQEVSYAGLITGIGLIGYGVLIAFVGSIGSAIRDIARNSYKPS